jgi:hypothetical protein
LQTFFQRDAFRFVEFDGLLFVVEGSAGRYRRFGKQFGVFDAQTGANLKPGKPYAGTELNLLTVVAPQFEKLASRLDESVAATASVAYCAG